MIETVRCEKRTDSLHKVYFGRLRNSWTIVDFREIGACLSAFFSGPKSTFRTFRTLRTGILSLLAPITTRGHPFRHKMCCFSCCSGGTRPSPEKVGLEYQCRLMPNPHEAADDGIATIRYYALTGSAIAAAAAPKSKQSKVGG